MNKYIKIFLLLLVACIGSFLIYDNVHAATSNSLDNDLTNINNHFEITPFYLFNDYKVSYCNDYGSTWCKDIYNVDSSGKIDVNFVDFLTNNGFDDKKTKVLYLLTKTAIDTNYETETPYIFFSLNEMYIKKNTYVENRPTPNFRGNTYKFLYSDDDDDNLGNFYYMFRKIGDKQFSFNVMSKEQYNVVFNVLYDTKTDTLYDDTYYIYSNYAIKREDGSTFVDSSTITVPPEQMSPLEKFIHDLFVPSNEFLEGWFTSIRDEFEKQLGFLAYPFTWVLDILENFLTLTDTGHYIISWNDVKVPNFDDHTIIHSGIFDLASLLENPIIKSFHDLYLVIIDSLMLLAFFSLCMNAYSRMFGGQVDNYEYISVDEGYNINPETGEVESQWVRERKTRKEKIK